MPAMFGGHLIARVILLMERQTGRQTTDPHYFGGVVATSNNMNWPLIGGLLHLVQQVGDLTGPQPAQVRRRCTKCNSPSINGQCANHYCCNVMFKFDNL